MSQSREHIIQAIILAFGVGVEKKSGDGDSQPASGEPLPKHPCAPAGTAASLTPNPPQTHPIPTPPQVLATGRESGGAGDARMREAAGGGGLESAGDCGAAGGVREAAGLLGVRACRAPIPQQPGSGAEPGVGLFCCFFWRQFKSTSAERSLTW